MSFNSPCVGSEYVGIFPRDVVMLLCLSFSGGDCVVGRFPVSSSGGKLVETRERSQPKVWRLVTKLPTLLIQSIRLVQTMALTSRT